MKVFKTYFGLFFILGVFFSCENETSLMPKDTFQEDEKIDGLPFRERGEECIIFEDLNVGETFRVSDVIASSGYELEFAPFYFRDGRRYEDGKAVVYNDRDAGGSGNDILLGNTNMQIHLKEPVECLSAAVANYGGNLNIEINGEFVNFDNWVDIHGAVIGGVEVTVTGGQDSPGRLILRGTIEKFIIGGQEFFIDDICFECSKEEDCVDFDDLRAGKRYANGEVFSSRGIDFEVTPFQWSEGKWTNEGYAFIDNEGLAGGSGYDLWTNNVNVRLKLPREVPCMSLLVADYGGNLNIEINGDFVNFGNWADIHGTTIGGVQVEVIGGDGHPGRLIIRGTIVEFAIGGQELWIGSICFDCPPPSDKDCISFEDLKLDEIYKVKDTFTSERQAFRVVEFRWDDGQWTYDGRIQVKRSRYAGGSGQELLVGNIIIMPLFQTPVQCLTLAVGEYGSNLNIFINGGFKNFRDWSDIHGATIGGVKVSVQGGHDRPGILTLKGTIEEFAIGGQELAIDNLCLNTCR